MIPYRMERLMMAAPAGSQRTTGSSPLVDRMVSMRPEGHTTSARAREQTMQIHAVSREENPARRASAVKTLIAVPSVVSLLVAVTVSAATAWCLAQSFKSTTAVFGAMLIYLFGLVAMIRLACFAAMLLSTQRHKDALSLLPVRVFSRRSLARLDVPGVERCKQIGLLVTAEATLLAAFLVWNGLRLWAVQ